MKIEDILALTNAGWTKEEILALGQDPKPAEKKPEEDSEPAEKKPEEDSEQAEKKPADIESINKRLDYLISKMNLAAVQKSQQPDEKKETVDDILASIFAKPDKKKEEK